jgi:hypothetical protein
VFGIPIVTFSRRELDHTDPRIIHTFGEPDLRKRLPEFLDLRLIL